MRTRRQFIGLVLCSLLLGSMLLASAMDGSLSRATPVFYSDVQEQTMDAMTFAARLQIGWNLGNTFDAPWGETSWGNPKTTRELLFRIKELGFETIRIPVSWGKHVSPAPAYTIDSGFLERVDTVVQDALEAGLYVIINSHHDNERYTPTPDNSQQAEEYLSAIWMQIASHYADAPQQLIFETMNEPRVAGSSYEWNINERNPDCAAAMEALNRLNQAALDAIRATGGGNADRFVMIPSYAAKPAAALSELFRLPEDSAQGRLLVSLHFYDPYRFAMDTGTPAPEFGKREEYEIKTVLNRIHQRFTSQGIPVVLGEMGCLDKDNPQARYQWAKTTVSTAKEYGIPCIWWDNGQIGGNQENFALLNRTTLAIHPQSQRVYEGLMEGLSAP